MRCTKHVFDLKVLLFIFLVESDPNFCGSGVAVAVLGCSASLSTLQTCSKCLTLVCNTPCLLLVEEFHYKQINY